MREIVKYFLYLAGVVLLSWNYHRLEAALDPVTLVVIVVMFLLGVARTATWLADRLPGARRPRD